MDKKVERIIKLYSYFLEGKIVNKKKEAERFEVNQRTIQRDIDDIRTCFANDMNVDWQIIYDRNKKGYLLLRDDKNLLKSQEIFMLCKVFMNSQLFVREEMFSVVDKLVQCCISAEEKKKVSALLLKEKISYQEPEHGKRLWELIKDICDAIYTQRMARIKYQIEEADGYVWKIVQPTGIIYSENDFYLTAYLDEEKVVNTKTRKTTKMPVVCRLDKIMIFDMLQEHFHIPYKSQYEETDFLSLIEKEIAVSREEGSV